MAYTYYSSISAKATAVGSNETNFPCALVITDARFKTVANGGYIHNTDSSGGASGSVTVPADFVISLNNRGTNPCDFEIVDYDATTGYIELWVEIPSLSSSSNTTIYLVYGDSSVTTSQENVNGTWDADYLGVWHLGEPSGTFYDSTSTGEDSTSELLLDYGNAGAIGDCPEFNEDDHITFSDNASFDFEVDEGFTIAFWTKTSDAGHATFVGKGSAASNDGWSTRQISGGNVEIILNDDSSRLASSTTVNDDSWHYVVARRTATGTIKIRVDDANEGTDTANNIDLETTEPLKFGMRNDSNVDLDGYLDEVMISTGHRDDDYIGTAYINQGATGPSSTFWTALGSQTSVPALVSYDGTIKLFDTEVSDARNITRGIAQDEVGRLKLSGKLYEGL